jgi:hypothetical protein
MSFQVQDIYAGVSMLLQGRQPNAVAIYPYIRDAVLELSEDYPQQLQEQNGPLVQLVPYQNSYPTSYFTVGNVTTNVNKFKSMVLYYNLVVGPLSTINIDNPNIPLRYKTIESQESALSIAGVPAYWSRFAGLLYFSPSPDNPYYVYGRYQLEPTFSNPISPVDVIPFDNSWQEIIEYSTAYRTARYLGLKSKAADFHSALFGDPKFQLTGGTEGSPGLIFKRTTQQERDQTLGMKSFRVRMSKY